MKHEFALTGSLTIRPADGVVLLEGSSREEVIEEYLKACLKALPSKDLYKHLSDPTLDSICVADLRYSFSGLKTLEIGMHIMYNKCDYEITGFRDIPSALFVDLALANGGNTITVNSEEIINRGTMHNIVIHANTSKPDFAMDDKYEEVEYFCRIKYQKYLKDSGKQWEDCVIRIVAEDGFILWDTRLMRYELQEVAEVRRYEDGALMGIEVNPEIISILEALK